jgi:serine/threonine-protein kinase TTK/MPS1
MVYGNLPFAHIGGGPLQKMNAIADPSHRILYPETATAQVPPQPGQGQGREADEAKAQAQAWTVTIPPAAIDAIKRCLMYRSNQRLTIPELLVHEFLRPKLASQTGAGLPLGATAITEQQMTRMYNWILDQHGIEVKPGDQTAAVGLILMTLVSCVRQSERKE